MEIKTIEKDGVKTRYFRFGNENGQPFIIIPGVSLKSVMGSADLVAAQYSLLADDHDIYLFDRREDMPDKYNIYDMADDTARAMDALGLKRAVIYVVSQGGMIAQVIAVRRPDLVSSMILCSAAAYVPDNSWLLFRSWYGSAGKNDIPELMRSFPTMSILLNIGGNMLTHLLSSAERSPKTNFTVLQ